MLVKVNHFYLFSCQIGSPTNCDKFVPTNCLPLNWSCQNVMYPDSLEVESVYDSDKDQEYVPQEYEMESKSDNELWMLESSLKKRKSKQVIISRKLQCLLNELENSQFKAKRSLIMKQKKATSQPLASAFVIPSVTEKISKHHFNQHLHLHHLKSSNPLQISLH